MSLVVRFSEISEAGSHFKVSDMSWIPAEMAVRGSEFQAEVALFKKSPTEVELRGALALTVNLTCDRCLGSFAREVKSDMQLILRCAGEEQWRVHEIECTEDDLDTVVVAEPAVDLGDILRQQLYLSLPLKQVCVENCRGLCKSCGGNLNERGCDCGAQELSSPFALLARLKTKD